MRWIGLLCCLLCFCVACNDEGGDVKRGEAQISQADPESDPSPPPAMDPIPIREEGGELPPLLSIKEIVESDRYVDRTFRVSGRYLGYDNLVAGGPPPVTRSDWQLQDEDGNVIYVTGKFPDLEGPQGSDAGLTTIVAVVAQDTLQALGNRPQRTRRYLVRVP